MDQASLEKLTALLSEKKDRIIGQLESIGHRAEGENNFDADYPQYGESMEDNATEMADYATNLSLEKDLEKELADVEVALKKITDGHYGKCRYCGKEIEMERLLIRPESNSCVSCKKALKGEN